jgi:hypothetical protein
LRASPADRDADARLKLELATRDWADVNRQLRTEAAWARCVVRAHTWKRLRVAAERRMLRQQ